MKLVTRSGRDGFLSHRSSNIFYPLFRMVDDMFLCRKLASQTDINYHFFNDLATSTGWLWQWFHEKNYLLSDSKTSVLFSASTGCCMSSSEISKIDLGISFFAFTPSSFNRSAWEIRLPLPLVSLTMAES